MDEHKEKDVSGSKSSSSTLDESTVRVSESETLVESMVCEVQDQGGQIEGSFTEEGEPCNGEDIMVEVLGSDVFIDGVCHGEGGGSGENLSGEAVHGHGGSVEAGLEKSLNGGNGVVDDLGQPKVGVSSDEVSSIKNGVDGSLVVRKEGLECELVEQGVDRCSGEVGIGSGVEGSSTGGETEVVHVEEGMGRVKEVVGSGNDVTENMNTQEVGVLGEETLEHGVENGVGGSSVVLGSSGGATQVVSEEVANVESEDGLHKETVAEGGKMVDGNALQDMKPQDVGILGNEVWKPGIDGAVAGVEDSSAQTHVVEAEAAVVYEEGLNHKDQISASETTSGGTEKLDADSKSADEQTQIAVGGKEQQAKVEKECEEDQKLKREECLDQGLAPDPHPDDSNIEQEMEVDKKVIDAEQVGQEHQQVKVETVGGTGSTQNHDKAGADSTNPCHSTQVVVEGNVQNLNAETLCMGTQMDSQVIEKGEEISTMGNQDALNSNVEVPVPAEKDEQLKPEVCLDKSPDCDREKMDIDELVTDAEQVSLPGGQHKEVQEQLAKVETGVSSESHGNVCEESMSVCQPTDAVLEGEVAAVDDKIGHDQNVKAATVSGSTEIDTQVTDGEQIASMGNEEALISNAEVLGPTEGACDLPELDGGQEMKVEEQGIDAEQVGLNEGQEIEAEELDTDTEHPKTYEEKFVKRTALKTGSSVKETQAHYQLPLEDEGEFSVSDLVWGKVRSHPWWPGQIFDPSDASEKAMKYHKKDSYLVAYFGDRTFAWNEASLLKPFRTHFSQIEKQSNSEAFQNAVDCALEEVSRRVELGLACSCIPKDTYDNIKFQIVENTGIRQELSERDGVDKSTSANSFAPDKLVDYMKALAQSPSAGGDRLELEIAKAQLLAFCRFKGYCELPEFQFCGSLLENDADASYFEEKMHLGEVLEHATPVYKDAEQISSQRSSYHRRKHNLKDRFYPSKKERSLSDLMGDSLDYPDGEYGPDGKATGKLVSPSSGKKRKAVDSFPDDLAMQEGRKTISLAKVSITAPTYPKPSFKIGDCIRRVASQMTGSPSILKSNSEKLQKLDGTDDGMDVDESEGSFQNSVVSTEYSSLDELLSQLHLAALDPMKGYSFFNVIISFFSDFRNSVVSDLHSGRESVGGKRKKSSQSIIGFPETFEFEDMSDTYWTDRIIQNGSEEQPSRRSRKRENQLVPDDPEKPLQVGRRSRKRYSDGNHDLAAEKPDGKSPAELLMNFSEVDNVPSETNLNKMFRHFGPIRESETEVDRETCRARVVFKRLSDAEVAYNSAGKFNIFGPVLVNYQLNYTISAPFKTLPMAITQGEEDATLYLEC